VFTSVSLRLTLRPLALVVVDRKLRRTSRRTRRLGEHVGVSPLAVIGTVRRNGRRSPAIGIWQEPAAAAARGESTLPNPARPNADPAAAPRSDSARRRSTSVALKNFYVLAQAAIVIVAHRRSPTAPTQSRERKA